MASKGAPRPTEPKSIEEVLAATSQTLAFAQIAHSDLVQSEERIRQVKGLMDVLVYGRAVTNVLAHIKTFDPKGWEEWYAPREIEMRTDPLLKYFYERRTIALKDGTIAVYETNRLETEPDYPPMGFTSLGSTEETLPGASLAPQYFYKSSVIKTHYPTGGTRYTYVPLPTKQSGRLLMLANPPTEHLGAPLVDLSAQMLANHYIHYLGDLVRDAIARFSPSNSSSA